MKRLQKHFKWINPLLFFFFPVFIFLYAQLYKALSLREFLDFVIWFFVFEIILIIISAIPANLSKKKELGPRLRFIFFCLAYLVILLLPLFFIAKAYFFPPLPLDQQEACKIQRMENLVNDKDCSWDLITDELTSMNHRLYLDAQFNEFPKDSFLLKEAYLLYATESHGVDPWQARVRYTAIIKTDSKYKYKRDNYNFEILESQDSVLYKKWKDLAWNIKMIAVRDSFERIQTCD